MAGVDDLMQDVLSEGSAQKKTAATPPGKATGAAGLPDWAIHDQTPPASPAPSQPASVADLMAQTQQQAETPTTPPPKPVQQDFLTNLGGSSLATVAGVPRGLFGNAAVDYLQAGLRTPFNMMQTGQGAGDAFSEALKREQQLHAQQKTQYPLASLAGEDLGSSIQGMFTAPYTALKAPMTPGFWPRVWEGAKYIGKNAGIGGAESVLDTGDLRSIPMGMGVASVLPMLHLGGKEVANLGRGAYNVVSNVVSDAARRLNIGSQLNRYENPANYQQAPLYPAYLPNGQPHPLAGQPMPLDAAQASNNNELAARVRYAQDSTEAGRTLAPPLRTQQQEAVRDQISQLGPQASLPDSARLLTTSARQGEDVIDNAIHSLWTVPELRQQTIPTSAVRTLMEQAVNQMPLGIQAGFRGNLRTALDLLDRAAPNETVGNLNAIRTAIRTGARPTADNPWAPATANYLENAFLNAMDRTLQSQRVPAGILQAWHNARDFTRQARGPGTALDNADMQRVLNPDRTDLSEVSRGLFNFGYGSPEGPEAIGNMARFLRTRIGTPEANQVADNLTQAARSHIAGAIRDVGNTEANEILRPQRVMQFIDTNMPWMRSSGMFSQDQLRTLQDLRTYTDMLDRSRRLTPPGSATQPRAAMQGTFVDQIVAPWISRVTGSLMAGIGGHEAGGIGAMIGHGVGTAAEATMGETQQRLTSLMAQALFDPELARALQTRASAQNRVLLPPWIRQRFDALMQVAPGMATAVAPRAVTEQFYGQGQGARAGASP